MSTPLALIWDLIARDKASPVFNRVAGAAGRAAGATEAATKGVAGASAAMSRAGAKLAKGLTVPLLGIAGVSVKAATDFQSSMTRIQTQAGASSKDVSLLTKQVLAMKGAQQGPNELADALYHLKSVGMDNVDAMKALKVGSDLAAVGNADLESTVNALAGAWRTGIKGARDFHQAAATVNAVIGAGNMTLTDLTDAFSTGILPSAKTFGLTLKDVGSALALFTDESVPANVAATRLRMSFSLLAAPSDKAEKILNSIGVTGFQLGQDMRRPNGLINAIGDLKDHLDEAGLHGTAAAQLLSRAFGGGRSSSAILSMINNFDVLKQKQDQVTGSIGKYDAAVKTQSESAAAEFHRSLAQFEQAGVKLGTQLLPIATDVAHAVTHIASAFNGLSDGEKHFIVEAGLALAILGPLLSIAGKIGKAFLAMWALGARSRTFVAGLRQAEIAESAMATKAYAAGNAVGTMWSRISTGAKVAGAAVAGAGIGFAIGSMTREASRAQKAVGALSATLSGAAVGFAVAGGPGAAIGALTGLLGDLAGAFGLGGGGASDAAKHLTQNVEDLTAALKRDGDVVGKTAKAWVANKLAQDGVLDQLDRLGLSYNTVTAAALGHKDALAQVNAAGQKAISVFGANGTAAAAAADDVVNLGKASNYAKQEIANQVRETQKSKLAHDASAAAAARNADAVSRLAAGSLDSARGSKTAAGAMRVENTAALGLYNSLKDLTKQYLKTVDAALGLKESQLQFLDSLHSMSQALHDSNGSLNEQKTKGRAAAEALVSAAQGAKAMDDGTRKGNAALLQQIQTLRQHALGAGADKGQVDKLLGAIKLLPSQIRMELDLNTGASMAKLREIQTQINSLHGKTLFVGVAGGHTLGFAAGGLVRGPGTGTSDSILARLSNREFVMPENRTKQYLPALEAMRAGRFGAFANGGQVGTRMPAPNLPAAKAGGSARPTHVRATGTLAIDADSQGRLYASFRNVVLDELDFDDTLAGM